MRKKLTFACLISLLFFATTWAQKSEVIKSKDTLRKDNSYGLRVGVDLQNIVTSLTNSNFQGIEFLGDYRLSKKFFLAGEIGNQKRTLRETSISTTTDGSYIKLGLDYNTHKNLIGLRNLIYVGFRYGYANFSQELNSFNIATQDNFFGVDSRVGDLESDGLSGHWVELLGGMKVEVLKNVYIGISVSIQRKIAEQTPSGFDNLYIPGFGLTNDLGEINAGYRYFVSYYIPLYKRSHKVKKEKDKKSKKDKDTEAVDVK